jgi:hypothetical protein
LEGGSHLHIDGKPIAKIAVRFIEIVVWDWCRDGVDVKFGDWAGEAFGVKLPTRNVVETLGDIQETARYVEKAFPRLGIVLEEGDHNWRVRRLLQPTKKLVGGVRGVVHYMLTVAV